MAYYTLRCDACGKAWREDHYRCPACDGTLHVHYDLSESPADFRSLIQGAARYWDYAPLLPVRHPEKAVTLCEGATPLLRADALAGALEVAGLYLKNEAQNPSGTFKDRCMSISVTKALEDGDSALVIGSAGNAGAAAAAYAAKAQLPCYVFVPATTPKERVAQIAVCGAKVLLLEGGVTDCIEVIRQVAPGRGWRNITTAACYHPFQAEAEKTIAYEMAKQMDWQVPDWVVVPIGGGGILTGIYQGYKDLLELGLTDRLPRMVGVQETGCAAVAEAFRAGLGPGEIPTIKKPTGIAVAIRDAYPLDGPTALAAIYDSRGAAVDVSAEALLTAQRQLASLEGVYAEPASSVTAAAVAQLRAQGRIGADHSVACVITGSGMKQMGLTAQHLPDLPVSGLRLEAVVEALDRMDA